MRESGVGDSDRAVRNREFGGPVRGQVQDQGAPGVALAVQDAILHGERRVSGGNAQRGEVARVHECGFTDGG